MDFPYGQLVNELPEGFAVQEMWPEYFAIANPSPIWERERVGKTCGYRWALWPFCFEQYIGDEEPDLKKSNEGKLARNRLIIWKRVLRKDVPHGWFAPSKKPWRVDGFYLIDKKKDYHSGWSHGARYDLRLWQKSCQRKKYAIENISLENFIAAYLKSTVARKIGDVGLDRPKRKHLFQDGTMKVEILGVRNRISQEIIAGMFIYFSDKYKMSVYECPFATNEGLSVHAVVGLIDHWFSDSMRRGGKIQLFSSFWYPGAPEEWKGYSEFKSHFNLKYVAYPPVLWRFARGKLY